MEGDEKPSPVMTPKMTFQSTPSAWRETYNNADGLKQLEISIHSLRMEGDGTTSPITPTTSSISIHSLRMEGDASRSRIDEIAGTFQSTPSAWRETEKPSPVMTPKMTFQSTPSAWRETNILLHKQAVLVISIHSLRMEGDNCAK